MPKAILSVHDKTGLVDFARGLVELGWDSARFGRYSPTSTRSRAAGHRGGRLHRFAGNTGRAGQNAPPGSSRRAAGPLDRSDQHELHGLGWDYIDLVAVNLYPFETDHLQTGCHPRGSDREYRHRRGDPDPRGGQESRAGHPGLRPSRLRRRIAELQCGGVARRAAQSPGSQRLFRSQPITTRSSRLSRRASSLRLTLLPSPEACATAKIRTRRRSCTVINQARGPLGGKVLQGKELSYNNLLDLDAAWRASPVCSDRRLRLSNTFHPAGLPRRMHLAEAYRLPWLPIRSRPTAGSSPATARWMRPTAAAIKDLFVECIIAPGFRDRGAGDPGEAKKNLRLVEMPGLAGRAQSIEMRSITRGCAATDAWILATRREREWKVVSERQPSEEEWAALRFAWKACQHVKVQRDCLCPGDGHGWNWRRAAKPGRLRAHRGPTRWRARQGRGDGFRRILPLCRSVRNRRSGRHHRGGAPGRLDARRRDRWRRLTKRAWRWSLTGVRHFRH